MGKKAFRASYFQNLSSSQAKQFRGHCTYFFYKQPVYKQLALRWQIDKQILGLNLLSLSNNKNYRLKKGGVFPLKQT